MKEVQRRRFVASCAEQVLEITPPPLTHTHSLFVRERNSSGASQQHAPRGIRSLTCSTCTSFPLRAKVPAVGREFRCSEPHFFPASLVFFPPASRKREPLPSAACFDPVQRLLLRWRPRRQIRRPAVSPSSAAIMQRLSGSAGVLSNGEKHVMVIFFNV